MNTEIFMWRKNFWRGLSLITCVSLFLFVGSAYGQSEEIIQSLINEGSKLFDNKDISGAIAKWKEGLEASSTAGDKRLKRKFLFRLGGAYSEQGDYQKAVFYYEQSLKISRELGNKKGEGIDLTKLGDAYRESGNNEKAIPYYEQALKTDRELGDKKGEGIDLKNLADAYRESGNNEKAIPYYEQALQINREIGNKKGEGIDLTKLGDAYRESGNNEKAIPYYEQALKTDRELGDKKGEGIDLTKLGDAYRESGNNEKAIPYYEQALQINREIGNKKGEGVDLTALGGVYKDLGNYQKAVKYYEQAFEIDKELGDKKGIGVDLNNLGIVYGYLGSYQKAISCGEEALKIDKELGNKKGIGADLTNLGLVYDNLGEYQKAIAYYEEALKVKKEIGDKKGVGNNLTNLGIMYRKLGEYQKAISYLGEALKIDNELGDKRGRGTEFTSLGNVYQDLGSSQKAISYFEQALKIDRELGDRRGEGLDLNNLGISYEHLGDCQKAIIFYEQSLKIKKEIGISTESSEGNIGDAFLRAGNIEKAEEVYFRIGTPLRLGRLNLVKKSYAQAIENFEKSLKQQLKKRDAEFLFADYCGLGGAYLGLKNYQKARENYQEAIGLSEDQRESLGEEEKTNFFSAQIQGFFRTEPYEGMVQALIALKQNEEAFFYSEGLRARLLAEAIGKGHQSAARALPAELAKEEESYTTRIRGLRLEMENLYRNKAMEAYGEKKKELQSVKSKQQDFISKLRNLFPEYASINYPQPIRPADLKLKNGEALAEFEVTEDKTYLFILKDGKVSIREITITRKDLQDLVLTYRNYFEGIGNSNDLLNFKADSGKKLYNLLFGDMLNNLPAGTSLIIVPDEFLGVLPFEALITEMPAKEQVGEGKYGPFPLGVKYLGDKYSIVYAQSGTSLAMLRSLKKGTTVEGTALAVCDPIFSKNDKRLAATPVSEADAQVAETASAIREWKKMGVAGLKEKGAKPGTTVGEEEIFPRLEKTGEIAKGVKGLFGDKATVLVGDKAREEDVVKLPFSQYRYITFATHGILDNALPWIKEPALVLNQMGNSEGSDGFLTMSEVMGLKMGAEVVTLTACETGVGKNVRGEGVMGMGRAFQYAGAGNVLMSLWSVAEDATVALSNSFFRNLKEGKDSKEALRLARAEIRKAGYEHPFYWSAFILVGR